MALEDDVLVIGGGLAGTMAALSAADRGVGVRLVTHKESTLRHASGLIDVLGYTPAGEGPLVDPFDALEDLPDDHPYRLVGLEGVREGLSRFDAVVGDAYAGDHTDRNALVPTHGGTVKPTARYPTSTAAGLASDDRDALLVGFETIPTFDAPLAVTHLEAVGVPFSARGVTLRFPEVRRDDAKVTRYAHLLGRDEGVRERLAGAVEGHLDDESRVGFPAILGENRVEEVQADLESTLGVDVFEIPTGPPSLPGMRLEALLCEALEEAGVRVRSGAPVVDYRGEGEIEGVVVDRNGAAVPHRADQYVLATGGLVGKGVDSSRERVREPVFDCHVPHPDDRYDWFDDAAFGDHEFARFGVVPDGELRPLGAGGEPEFSNLRAAGGVVGGYDFAAEKSGAGVSIATGYVAGRRAATEVGR